MKQQHTAGKELNDDELSALCWQLFLLGRSGISWAESADLLLEDSQPTRIRDALERLREPLSAGSVLSQALKEAGGFPEHLLRMVEIGEASGRLDEVLATLSEYYRQETDTQAAVSRAVTYPAVMSAIIALVLLILTVRVLPVFSQVFAQLGAGISPGTAALFGSGAGGKMAAYLLSGLLLAGSAVLLLFFRGRRSRTLFSRGAAGQALARGQFASSMALMLQSGLSTEEALDRTGELLAGSSLEKSFADCRRRMEDGASFPRAVEDAGVLTGLQAGLLAAGFRAGSPEEAMTEVARRAREEAENRLNRGLSRLEYTLVVVLCAAVALVLLSVMLPLLGVLSAIGG